MSAFEKLHADEVTDIAAFLRELSDEQWEHSTLCTEFTVRHMIGHMLSASDTSIWQVLRRLVAAGFDLDQVTVAMARERADHRAPKELIMDFEAHDPRSGLSRVVPLKSTFLERVVHHQDMRRPLGMPREVPPSRLTAVLDVAWAQRREEQPPGRGPGTAGHRRRLVPRRGAGSHRAGRGDPDGALWSARRGRGPFGRRGPDPAVAPAVSAGVRRCRPRRRHRSRYRSGRRTRCG